MTHDDALALIRRQFDEGSLSALEAEALRVHLRGCDACRAIYDAHARLEREMDGGQAQAHRLVARGWAQPAVRPRRRWPWVAGLAVAAAAALVLFVLRSDPPAPDWSARGDGAGVQARIGILKLTGKNATPTRIDGPIRPSDGLIFTYTNPTRTPFSHLLVMGRDARGTVRWYHPQWTDPARSPVAVAVRPGADVPLPTAIWHDYAPGPLEVCAIFAHTPLPVRPLDARLEGGAWPPEGGRCQTIQVQP